MVRRAEDMDDTGALSRQARIAWQLLVLIGTILGSAGAVIAYSKALAHDEAVSVVAPIEKALNEHMTRTEAMVPQMLQYARDQRAALESLQANQYQICLKLQLATCEMPRSQVPRFEMK